MELPGVPGSQISQFFRFSCTEKSDADMEVPGAPDSQKSKFARKCVDTAKGGDARVWTCGLVGDGTGDDGGDEKAFCCIWAEAVPEIGAFFTGWL